MHLIKIVFGEGMDLMRQRYTWFRLSVVCAVVVLSACAGEVVIQDRYSMDYLDAKTGKPLDYPLGIERPMPSLDYAIPALPASVVGKNYDVNEVIKPPRIVPIPQKTDEEEDTSQDEAEESG